MGQKLDTADRVNEAGSVRLRASDNQPVARVVWAGLRMSAAGFVATFGGSLANARVRKHAGDTQRRERN